MIDPKSQLNLFGKARRASVVHVDVDAVEVEQAPAHPSPEPPSDPVEELPANGVDEASEDQPEQELAVAEPEEELAVAEPAEPSPVEKVDAGAADPAPDDVPAATLVAEETRSTAVLPGLRPPTGARYLFPPSQEGRRVDMRFSRRMSDLIRRLQLLEREGKADLGLTLPQAHAIHALDTAGSLRMQELAATLGLAQSTVTRLVAPLKRMGLLDRRPDRNDGRATRAYLTDQGQLAVDQLEAADRDLYRGLLDRIPPMRRAEVVAAIELLHEVTLAVARGED